MAHAHPSSAVVAALRTLSTTIGLVAAAGTAACAPFAPNGYACTSDDECMARYACSAGVCVQGGVSAPLQHIDEDAGAPTSATRCGDGHVDRGEACDDGNAADGDGCTAGCVLEVAECTDASAPCGAPFAYAPSHFEPIAVPPTGALALACGVTLFDTDTLAFANLCAGSAAPAAHMLAQPYGSDIVVLSVTSLAIAAGSTLRAVGARPLVVAVFGDARLDGALDVAAQGATTAAGSGVACASGVGLPGTDAASTDETGGGGGGGGFVGAGATGGNGGNHGFGGSGGPARGDEELRVLIGGCAGASGGKGKDVAGGRPGAGGGALQLSASGDVVIAGIVSASGGGGGGGGSGGGGGGGGSGGAVLVESARLVLHATARVTANGGAGGEGGGAGLTGADGIDGARDGDVAATGGHGTSAVGGNGGTGSAADLVVGTNGANGGMLRSAPSGDLSGGGGGGGGGAGRIRLVPHGDCDVDDDARVSPQARSSGGAPCGARGDHGGGRRDSGPHK